MLSTMHDCARSYYGLLVRFAGRFYPARKRIVSA